MSEMIKGWKSLVHEAITKIIREEITDQLNKKISSSSYFQRKSGAWF